MFSVRETGNSPPFLKERKTEKVVGLELFLSLVIPLTSGSNLVAIAGF